MATARQRRAVAKLAGNGGNVSKAMRDAGYSDISANTPAKLTNSKGFQELLDEYLPEMLLTQVHAEGLKATKLSNSLTAPDIELPDYAVRHKYLETGYKVRGKLKENEGGNRTLVLVVSGETAARYGLPTHTKPESSSS